MSTTTTPSTAAPAARPVGELDPRGKAAAAWLLGGLCALCAYAAFWHGATDLPAETRLQVAGAVVALLGVVAWLTGLAPPRVPRLTLVGIGLLFGFAVWTGLSLLWSVAPDNTWVELNRSIDYLLVATLAVAAASRARDPLELVGRAWLGIAVAVAAWALAGKVAPWIHVGPLDLNQTAIFSRLRAPLGYWNALGLVCVLGAPLALRYATDVTRERRTRVWALRALAVLFVATGLTYSRGAILALVVAIATTIWLGGPRLRGLLAFALAAAAAGPAVVVDFSSHALTSDSQPLADRVVPGLAVGAALAVSLFALGWLAARLIDREASANWSEGRAMLAWRRLRRGAAAALALAVLILIFSGALARQWDSFTTTKSLAVSNPSRLLSVNSGNRWVWWKEAAGAFSARPLLGWGAGSFPVTHLLYRQPPPLPVRQPHSVPLQLLAETGLVGAVLALGGVLALLAAALSRVRSLPPGRQRDLAGAFVAAAAAWLVHGLVDWDLDIPGVTLPALLLLGVASAPPTARRVRLVSGWPPRGVPLYVAIATVATAAVVSSAILPAWSQSKAQSALALAANAKTPADLERAVQAADLAARLDPLASRPLEYAATISARRGLLIASRSFLLKAVHRQPDDVSSWAQLTNLAAELGDRIGFERAAGKVISLDPLNPLNSGLVALGLAAAALPQDSPTAIVTPLGP
jgi:hypothetical protein